MKCRTSEHDAEHCPFRPEYDEQFLRENQKNIMDKKESEADKRFRKKVSQMVMLLEREKVAGKIDWHSREHLSGDAHCVATAINSYVKSK